jgi:hypothetical protein
VFVCGEGGTRTVPFSGFIFNDLPRLTLAGSPNFPPCDLAADSYKDIQIRINLLQIFERVGEKVLKLFLYNKQAIIEL